MLAHLERQNIRMNQKRSRGFLVFHSLQGLELPPFLWRKKEWFSFMLSATFLVMYMMHMEGFFFFFLMDGLCSYSTFPALKNTRRKRTRCLQSARSQVLSTKQGRYRQWEVLRIFSEHRDQSDDFRASPWGGLCYYQVYQKEFHMAPIVWCAWMHIWL